MKIKWSGIAITDGRGKAGGSVASRNTFGAYIRNKVTPVNVDTVAQQTVRAFFLLVSETWRTLTQVQRDAWITAAPDWAENDIFADSVAPTGFSLYMRLNLNLVNIGFAQITVPPAQIEVASLETLSLDADTGGGTMTATFTATPVPADQVLVFQSTAGQSAGKQFVKSEYRKIDNIATGEASPQEVGPAYESVFGILPAVGSKVFIQGYFVDSLSGQVSSRLAASVLAA